MGSFQTKVGSEGLIQFLLDAYQCQTLLVSAEIHLDLAVHRHDPYANANVLPARTQLVLYLSAGT